MSVDEPNNEKLWELVYGLLPDDEAAALCARVESDPVLARAYAAVKLRSDLLAQAARIDEPGAGAGCYGQLVEPQASASHPATDDQGRAIESEAPGARRDIAGQQTARTARPVEHPGDRAVRGNSAAALRRQGLRALAALAATLLLGFGTYTTLRSHLADYGGSAASPAAAVAKPKFVSLIVPDALQREITNPVIVSIPEGGAPVNLEFRVYDDDNQLRLQQLAATDSEGISRVALPGRDLPERGRLEVVAADDKNQGITADLAVNSSNPRTYFFVDKPFYSPGETLSFRAVTMSRFESPPEPPADPQVVELQDAIGNTVDGAKTLFSRNGVTTGSFDIPADAAEGNYQLIARQGAEDARHSVDVLHDSSPRLAAPADAGSIASGLALKSAPARSGSAIEFYPEGGTLVAGLENRVYLYAANSAGEPLDLSGQVVDQDGTVVAAARTEYRGRGVFTLRPAAGRTYSLSTAAFGETRLPAAAGDGLVLHSLGGVFSHQDPIEVEIQADRPQETLILTASCQQAIVGLDRIESGDFLPADDASFVVRRQIPVVPEASGLMWLTVFDGTSVPPRAVAKRPVFFRSPQSIEVAVEGLQDRYQLGQQITLTLVTTDESGAPRSAILDASLTAEDLSNASGPAESLPTYYYLAEELRSAVLSEADCDWVQADDPERALDLVLGAQASNGMLNDARGNDTLARREARQQRQAMPLGQLSSAAPPALPKVFVSSRAAPVTVHTASAPRDALPQRLALAAIVASLLLGALLLMDAVMPYVGQRNAILSMVAVAAAGLVVCGIWWETGRRSPVAGDAQVAKLEQLSARASSEQNFHYQANEMGGPSTEAPAAEDQLAQTEAFGETKELAPPPPLEAPERWGLSRPKAAAADATAEQDDAARSTVSETDAETEAEVLNQQQQFAQPANAPLAPRSWAASADREAKAAESSFESAAVVGGRAAGEFRQVLRVKEASAPPAANEMAGPVEVRQPALLTDGDGRATVTIQLPSRPTVLRLRVDAQSAGRLGAIERQIVVGPTQ